MPTKPSSGSGAAPAVETAASASDTPYLNQKQLARRWNVSHRTIERWRAEGRGPAWVKFGGRILYRIDDVVRYEQEKLGTKATT